MFEIRTDLALESHEINVSNRIDDGVEFARREEGACVVSEAVVLPGEGEKKAGRPAGRYVTIEFGRLWQSDKKDFDSVCEVAAKEIAAMLPEGEGCVLAAGLGNESITPDSVGPRAVKSLIVTRHLKTMAPKLYSSAGFGDLAATAPGVLGQTGIESAEMIASACAAIKPKCVILIDSLAARKLARLATTLQISESGISPGSGVFNRRAEINAEKLGAKVISIGVPTVVDAKTLAADLLEQCGASLTAESEKLLDGVGSGDFVTPKESDVIARCAANLIAAAINRAVHGLTPEEMKEFIA